MKPLVSILIPAYNSAATVAECLESAINQTWPNNEIILVDDGSTDETLAVARCFASKGVVIETQPNQGASAARNKAYSLCRGEYIQWLDADDLLAPDKIEWQMKAVEAGAGADVLLAGAWGTFYYRPHKAKFVPSPLWADLEPVDWLIRKLQSGAFLQTASWLVSRELSDAAGSWDSRLLSDDDGEYFCRVLMKAKCVRFIPEARMLYRIPSTSSLSFVGTSERKKEALLLSMKLHIQYLLSLEDSERVRSACVTFLQTWLLTFYPERPDLVKEMEGLAAELGGRLEAPSLRWKYSWIQPLFGWGIAKRAQLFFPHCRVSASRICDRSAFRLSRLWRAAQFRYS